MLQQKASASALRRQDSAGAVFAQKKKRETSRWDRVREEGYTGHLNGRRPSLFWPDRVKLHAGVASAIS